jgi:DNA (cytosine-5)-methyltransferase 1
MRAIDLFAGWGGMTEGATQAGVNVVWAADYWALAVETHAANHPATEHVCQDLRQADWTAVPEYDVLLASPACQGHSEAAQPRRFGDVAERHDALRATAWAVVDCAEVTRPRAVVVENVVPFRRWVMFDLWCEALRTLGYTVDVRTVSASRCGVPQRRDRLFVLATRGHVVREIPQRDEVPFGPCVEWAAGRWRPVAEASPGARVRFEAARSRFGRALVQHVTGHRGVPLSQPIRTITTKDQWCVLDEDRYRPLTIREYARGMGFRDSYRWPQASRSDTIKGLGNAVPPGMAREVVTAVTEAIT